MQGRKRGVGVIWRYANPQSKVEYLTLPPEALKTLDGDADALLTMLREALCYVSVDPANAKLGIGELSGKALEWFHKKQTDRCTKIREDFGHNCLLPLVNMLLRIVLAKGADKTAPLYIAGLDAMLPILAKFEQAMAPQTANDNAEDEPESRWFPPYLKLVWGAYFPATAADAKSDMDMTIAGLGAKILTMKVAVSKIAPHFPAIDDLTQYLESLEEEAREAMGKMHDAQQALMNAGQSNGEEPAEPDEEMQGEAAPAKAPPAFEKAPKPKRVPPQRKPPAAKAKPAFKKRVKKAA
jgi:hypothetical protein